ncbi:MAG: acyltransferase [Fuerstiella sp.]
MKRIPSIDGLRAISVVMVLAAHSALTVDFPTELVSLFRVGGQIGVRVFFVLSGYLITWLLMKEEGSNGNIDLKGFFVRRSLRILPVYFAYIAVAAIMTSAGMINISTGGFAHAMTFTTGWLPIQDWALAHTWSLAVEEQFYLFWPFAFALAPVRYRMRLATALILMAPIGRLACMTMNMPWLINYSFIGNGDAIMWGCAGAMFLNRSPDFVTRLTAFHTNIVRCLAVAILFGSEACLRMHLLPVVTTPITITIQSVCISYIIFSVTSIRQGMIFTVLNNKSVARLGVLSYSIYLWQQLALFPADPTFEPAIWQRFPQNLVCVFAMAICSYHLIETPFLRLKTRMHSRRAAIPALDPSSETAPILNGNFGTQIVVDSENAQRKVA